MWTWADYLPNYTLDRVGKGGVERQISYITLSICVFSDKEFRSDFTLIRGAFEGVDLVDLEDPNTPFLWDGRQLDTYIKSVIRDFFLLLFPSSSGVFLYIHSIEQKLNQVNK